MTPPTLDAARAGDEQAFRELTEPYLRELHVHCYRMLGSVHDADDLTQETLIAAWRGIDGFEERSSLRTWLYRIATNRCLNAIRDGKRRPPPAPVPPFEPPTPTTHLEVPWLQPYPDGPEPGDPAESYLRRESIELAFVTALQLLPPRQTAALLLADVLGFTTAEVADMLGIGRAAAKGLLQRARATTSNSRPGPGSTTADDDSELAGRFAAAFSRDDVAGVISLLTDDAWLAMPPATHEYHGLVAVAEFLRASADGRGGRYRLIPTRANSQPAFGCYLHDGRMFRATGLVVLATGPGGITGITRFLDPRLNERFDLPADGWIPGADPPAGPA